MHISISNVSAIRMSIRHKYSCSPKITSGLEHIIILKHIWYKLVKSMDQPIIDHQH